MAYKVEYGMDTPEIKTTKKVNGKWRVDKKKMIILALIIAFAGVCLFTDVLIPGDPVITKAAVSELISDVKSGGQVVDAFAAFCQTVLQSN